MDPSQQQEKTGTAPPASEPTVQAGRHLGARPFGTDFRGRTRAFLCRPAPATMQCAEETPAPLSTPRFSCALRFCEQGSLCSLMGLHTQLRAVVAPAPGEAGMSVGDMCLGWSWGWVTKASVPFPGTHRQCQKIQASPALNGKSWI